MNELYEDCVIEHRGKRKVHVATYIHNYSVGHFTGLTKARAIKKAKRYIDKRNIRLAKTETTEW